MKKYNTLLLLIVAPLIYGLSAAAQGKKVTLSSNQVSQLIFPSNIKKIKCGFSTKYFAIENFERVLYIQPLIPFEASNMSVVTQDNNFYTFPIQYGDSSASSIYIFTPEDALFMPESNIIATPPAEAPEGAIQESDQERTATTGKESSESTAEQDPNIKKILSRKGYITSQNGIRYKSLSMYLKGIYIKNQELYFRLEISNNSYIPYELNYLGFSIRTKKKGRITAQETLQLTPSLVYMPGGKIQPKGSAEVIYKFPQFTIGKNKLLMIDLIEESGERNLTLPVNDETILEAQPVF